MNWDFFRQQSFKTRVTLTTLGIFVTSLWSLAFYGSHMLHKDLERLLSEQQSSAATYVAADINGQFKERFDALNLISGAIDPLLFENPAALQKFIEQHFVLHSLFSGGVIAYGPDNVAVADYPKIGRTGVNYSDRDSVVAAIQEGKSSISRPAVGKKLQTPSFLMTVPIRNKQGDTIGALSGVVDLSQPNFLNRITENQYGKTGGYLLISKEHRLIVTATDRSRVMEALPAFGVSQLIDRFIQGYEGTDIFVNPMGMEVLVSAKGVPIANWYVAAMLPTTEAFAPIKDLQQRMLLATIILTILAGVLTWWRLRRELSPLLSAAKTLAAMSSASTPLHPLPISRQDEIGALIGGFNHLLETLEQRDAALRESHDALRSILDTSQDGFWKTDVEGKLLEVNPAYCDMSGYTREELQGMCIADLDAKDSVDEAAEYISLLKKHTHSQFETIHRRKDGSLWNVEVSGTYFISEKSSAFIFLRDITERKHNEELIKKRILSLTQPTNSGDVSIEDLFQMDELQRIQNEFAAATGVASIITRLDGTPITAPSNFTHLCQEIIRKTEKGRANCFRSDAIIGRNRLNGPIVQPCLSGGLWDAGVSITVGGHHIANWLIGQVRDETQTIDSMRAYANEIGADEPAFMKAFLDVPSMSRKKFDQIAQALFTLANQLSTTAFNNIQQARFISERKQAEEKLNLAANVFTHAREGIIITTADGDIVEVNDAFTRITGYGHDEVLGLKASLLKSGQHDRKFYSVMWRDLVKKGQWYGELWNKRKNGEIFAVMQTITAVRDAQGVPQHYVALFSDITALKEHERQLEHIAHYDALTTLPNRVLLADRLHQAMTQTRRRRQRLAVAYLDMDGFKTINDHHGHEVGDQLLIALAARMKQTLREGDTLARMGGDEFIAVLLDLADIETSVPMFTRLLAAAAHPENINGHMLQVSASIGVTFYPQAEDMDADQLLRQADQAMYQAKLAGKNRYHVFDAEQDRSVRGHHESLEHIRHALTKNEFVLYYQPKVNMRTGKIIGVEALIRWRHPEKGMLAPDAFLPVIEFHPLAIEVGEWVINTALTQKASWDTAGLNLPISINLSARQLQQTDFVARLQQLLSAHPHIKPGDLELEVLETSALEDLVRVSQVIEACRDIGVSFALDDFGTGYSSLTYLKRLPVSQIKIDQSFVHDMIDNPDDLAILEGVIDLATAFRRQVIAEGVETVAQGSILLQLGCELAQGYVIARPMPAADLPAWAANWRPDPAWINCP